LIFVVIEVYILSSKIKEEKHQKVTQSVLSYFEKTLNLQKSNALTLAILLSQNEALKEALIDLDEEKGHTILFQTLFTLKQYTFIKDVRGQVIGNDLTIFARSWDKEFVGMPIEGFRKDLSSFKITKPKVSIETGRLLTIKAIAPLKKGYKTLGYMEIISFFEPLSEKLRKHGIELFVLMKNRYLDVATLMRENPEVQNFIVSNRNYNTFLLPYLEKIDLKKLKSNGYLFDGERLFIHKPMRNSQGDNLGMFVLVLGKRSLEKFLSLQENISFFLNFNPKEFYDIIDIWERPQGSFKSVYDRSVIEFLSKSPPSPIKKEFEKEAREILKEYSKEELINIIIQKYHLQKKKGVIQ